MRSRLGWIEKDRSSVMKSGRSWLITKRVKEILATHQHKLEELAQTLLDVETVDRPHFEALMDQSNGRNRRFTRPGLPGTISVENGFPKTSPVAVRYR